MRVVHLIHSLRRGGAERMALELSLAMRERGVDARVLSLLDVNDYSEERYQSVPAVFLMRDDQYHWPWVVPELARRLRVHIQHLQPDAIEIHTPTAAVVAAMTKMNAPAVEVFHGFGNWQPGFLPKRWAFYLLQRWAWRRLKRRGIAVSEALRYAVISAFPARGEAVCTIYNGIAIERFPWVERTLTERPVIIVVGTLSESKRPHDAVAAFARLREALPGAKLRFVGEGGFRPKLEKLVSQLKLQDAVEFLGMRADVPDLLAGAHLLWMLSEMESFSIVTIEAMATGLPVVATGVGGLREVVVDGETGWLVAPGDISNVVERSVSLLRDAESYARFSRAARVRVEEKFTVAKTTAGHLNAIETLIAGKWASHSTAAAAGRL